MLKLKLKLAVALFVGLSFCAAHAEDLNKVILAQETKVWESFVGSQPNAEAFGRLLTPDYVCIEPTGVLVNKEGNIAARNSLGAAALNAALAAETSLCITTGTGGRGISGINTFGAST